MRVVPALDEIKDRHAGLGLRAQGLLGRDTAGLSRVFHRQVGVSPSEYRRIFAGR
jgi:AraC-like DNA-binding protein